MEERVMSAKTVEEAIEVALKELDANKEEVEVEVLSRGKPGFLMISSEPARVRVRKISPDQSAASLALDVVNNLLSKSDVQTLATVRSAHDPDTGGPLIDIMGEDSGLLIGRRGETLRALQFLVNLIVKRRLGEESVRVILDIEGYRERRHNSLHDLALRVADRVANSGRPVSLEPMTAAERRVIHVSLADHPRVSTESSGIGENRNVTISPKEPQAAATEQAGYPDPDDLQPDDRELRPEEADHDGQPRSEEDDHDGKLRPEEDDHDGKPRSEEDDHDDGELRPVAGELQADAAPEQSEYPDPNRLQPDDGELRPEECDHEE